MALTPEEEAELARLEAEDAAASGGPPAKVAGEGKKEQEQDVLSQLKRAGLRTLDVGGAPIRQAASGAIEALQQGRILPESPGQFLRGSLQAAKEQFVDPITGRGEAPTLKDIRGQLGISDESLSVPLPADVPFVGKSLELAPTVDVLGGTLTDPLSLTTGGPAKQALQGAGRGVFRSGLKKIDAEIPENVDSFSKLALEEGFSGSNTKLLEQSQALRKRLGSARDKLFKMGDENLALIDFKPILDDTKQVIESVADVNPTLAKTLERRVAALRKQHKNGTLTLKEASDLKTQFVKDLPDTAFDINPLTQVRKLKTGPQKLIDNISGNLRQAVIREGDSVVPGLGQEIDQINRKFSTLGAAGKPLAKAAKAEQKASAIGKADVGIGLIGGLAAQDPIAGLLAFGATKGFDLSRKTGTRTRGGRAFEKLGDLPGLDTVLRRGAIEANQE